MKLSVVPSSLHLVALSAALALAVQSAPAQTSAEDLPVVLPRPLHEARFEAQCASEVVVALPELRKEGATAHVVPRAKRQLPAPEYSAAARRDGKEGTTSMLVLVNEDGVVVRAVIERSSGHRTLDQAALDVTRQWRFDPAFRNGKTVCTWGRFATTFDAFDEVDEERVRQSDAAARELANTLLSRDRLEASLMRAPLLRDTPTPASLLSEADTRVISRDDLRRLQLEYANLLSSNLSQQEILAINAFYRTPAGEKWMSVHAGIDRAVADRLALQIGAAACRIYLVQRDAHQAQEPAREAPSRRQIEKVITANEQYCHCAAAPFARSLMVGDAAGRDKLLDDIRNSGQCGSPAE